MSKQRRLQNEIDQTLRKITDGVEEWDVLFEKFEETEASGWQRAMAGLAARGAAQGRCAGRGMWFTRISCPIGR